MEKCPKHGLDLCEECSLDLYETENAKLRAEVERLNSLSAALSQAEPVSIRVLNEKLKAANLRVSDLQKSQYAAAIAFLKDEAKKIPLGQGDVEKGFSSTYNALIFCARELERAQTERRLDPQQNCDHKWAHIEDHHVICEKCKHVADLCWTCEAEKQDVGGILVCLNCRGH